MTTNEPDNLYIYHDLYDDFDIEFCGSGKPETVIMNVLTDIRQYSNDPADIWIGERVFAFDGRRMWEINKPRGKRKLTYDEKGEYFEQKTDR